MAMEPRPELFDFHGVQMVDPFTNNWENIQKFKAQPDDILIATYPKAGKQLSRHHFTQILSFNCTSLHITNDIL